MSMMDQLMGGGGGPPQGGQQPPPGYQSAPEQDTGAPTPDELSALQAASDAIQQYIQVETDEIDKAAGAKILASIHALLGGRQKEQESAIGMSPALKMVSRGSSGGGGY